MFNPEISRRLFLTGSAAVFTLLLQPQIIQAEEWIEVPNKPLQPWEYFPLNSEVAQNLGMHTLYEPGGPLDEYDKRSAEAGLPTNFRQKAEDLANWYFTTYPDLDPVYKTTTGFCHGVANALACGEAVEVNDFIKLGQLAALHSGDSMYMPGIGQLMEDLISTGRLFVVETKGPEGYWTRIAWAVNGGRTMIRTTDFGRTPKIILPKQVQKAYVPVPAGEERNFLPGAVKPAIDSVEVLARWSFSLDRRLIR